MCNKYKETIGNMDDEDLEKELKSLRGMFCSESSIEYSREAREKIRIILELQEERKKGS